MTTRPTRHPWIGSSPAMMELDRQLSLAAPIDAPVLITGETGTGKSLVAHALLARSQRADRPLVRTTCSDSSLADLPTAHTGTVLLDDVADLSPTGQSQM